MITHLVSHINATSQQKNYRNLKLQSGFNFVLTSSMSLSKGINRFENLYRYTRVTILLAPGGFSGGFS